MKLTLDQLYDGDWPDEHEQIWQYVGQNAFLDRVFTVRTANPIELANFRHGTYSLLETYKKFAESEQKELVAYYRKHFPKDTIIVVDGEGRVVDGQHRVIAAALNKRKKIQVIDISE